MIKIHKFVPFVIKAFLTVRYSNDLYRTYAVGGGLGMFGQAQPAQTSQFSLELCNFHYIKKRRTVWHAEAGYCWSRVCSKLSRQALRQVRTVEVAGIHALAGADALSATVKKWGVGAGTVYASIEEMAKHVDAVAVFAPNFARVEIVERIVDAVKKGAALKGVICEKAAGAQCQRSAPPGGSGERRGA